MLSYDSLRSDGSSGNYQGDFYPDVDEPSAGTSSDLVSRSRGSPSSRARSESHLRRSDLLGESSHHTSGPSTAMLHISRRRRKYKNQHRLREARSRFLTIGNAEEVEDYIAQRFNDLQQVACKLLAKAFVKAIEPRKQTNYPYRGGSAKAPRWWPPLPDDKEQSQPQMGRVRHLEPDHLKKTERLQLLVYVIQLTAMPAWKKAEVCSTDISIRKLEQVANEALAEWFDERSTNETKRRHLQGLFRVARQQERFQNGEVDASVGVCVLDEGEPYYESDTDSGSREHSLLPEAESTDGQQYYSSYCSGVVESLPAHVDVIGSQSFALISVENPWNPNPIPVMGGLHVPVYEEQQSVSDCLDSTCAIWE